MDKVNPPFYSDLSLWILLFSNGAAIALVLKENWSLTTIMMMYWVQSVIIGSFNVARILSLEKFSTENFLMNGKPVPPTEKSKRQVASFFALHYGFFHFVYATFLVSMAGRVDMYRVVLGGIVFLIDHSFSFRYNKKRDAEKVRNIGSLMFFPYARVVPMHLMILISGVFSSEPAPLLLFLGLKTLADAVMHIVEHRM